jgi:hypothetical protein
VLKLLETYDIFADYNYQRPVELDWPTHGVHAVIIKMSKTMCRLPFSPFWSLVALKEVNNGHWDPSSLPNNDGRELITPFYGEGFPTSTILSNLNSYNVRGELVLSVMAAG